MKFGQTLYHYQEDILKVFEREVLSWEKKIHIVAPPGSGKTIIGLEMLSRLEGTHLILVPSITLQYQWEDKIASYFLEEGEDLEEIVSFSTESIKKINILTYQSLSQVSRDEDILYETILDAWYIDIWADFSSREEFLSYTQGLKDFDAASYQNFFLKYRKQVYASQGDFFHKTLSAKVLEYLQELKKYSVGAIIVDEAHHLTSWWSKTIYYLWNEIWKSRGENSPFIIWLTATPPYEDSDFFILDDDYAKLLWEVDYYVPTPAVISSGRLAPYSDLVYFVEPDTQLKQELQRIDANLKAFLEEEKEPLSLFIFQLLEKKYEALLSKSQVLLKSYLRFLHHFSHFDISAYYFDDSIGDEIVLDDIAKAVGSYIDSFEQTEVEHFATIKALFYDAGYIWRGNNFYRFRTKIEQLLIYSESKLQWVHTILDTEIHNLWENLRCAIITDFLEEKEAMISCTSILKGLFKYKSLEPILLSGQGIWRLDASGNMLLLESNILQVTADFAQWKTKILIGTRGILWE